MQNNKLRIEEELKLIEEAKKAAKQLEILNSSVSYALTGENTHLLTQNTIKENVSRITKEKAISIDLNNGPYSVKHTQNGRHLLVYNKKGFLSSFDLKTLNLHFEIDLRDKIEDATFLNNELMIAAAQPSSVFVYDNQGTEIHCVRELKNTKRIEFLFYHFLMVCLSKRSLNYFDVSVGKNMTALNLNEEFNIMKQDTKSGLIYLGGAKGCVSVFSPNCKEYIVKINCCNSELDFIEINKSGHYLITGSVDRNIKTWDIRNTYKPLNTFTSLYGVGATSISEKNMLAIASKKEVLIYSDLFSVPSVYIKEKIGGVESLDFCNFEDILAVGHRKGIRNFIVPGSGNGIFDTAEYNPFETKKERRNREIKMLLEKIPIEFIGKKNWAVKEKNRKIEEKVEKKKGILDRIYGNK